MDFHRLLGPEGLALGHRSIEAIAHTEQSVTPRNYEIWLSYHTGAAPALRAAIDDMIAKGASFNDEAMDALYRAHFSRTTLSHDTIDTGSLLAHEVADALDALKFVAVHANRYGDTLDTAVTALAGAPVDASGLQRIISQLAKATAQMREQRETLAAKLTESSHEMEQLRGALDEARKQSRTDALTGVANRKHFDETLRMRHADAQQEGLPLVVAICDIDHFKKFNDAWGHQTGDAVIRLVASTLLKSILGDHLVARIGGEEFAMIMPRMSLQRAAEHADTLRRAIRANRLRRKETGEVLGQVTVSFGLASLRRGETALQLVARADECLYLSKRSGRDRVSIESEAEAA